MTDESDYLEFLARTPTRRAVLFALRGNGWTTHAQLRQRTDASRTTVSRTLDALVSRGWIESAGPEYRLTRLGAFVCATVEEFLDRLAVGVRLAPVLSELPEDEVDIDPLVLSDADVVVASAHRPYAPMDHLVTRASEAATIREVAPFFVLVDPAGSDFPFDERADVEVILQSDVFEQLRDDSHRGPLGDGDVPANTRVFVVDREIPFLLTITDEEVLFGVTDGGVPTAVLETRSEKARAWAESRFASYRAEATPVESLE